MGMLAGHGTGRRDRVGERVGGERHGAGAQAVDRAHGRPCRRCRWDRHGDLADAAAVAVLKAKA